MNVQVFFFSADTSSHDSFMYSQRIPPEMASWIRVERVAFFFFSGHVSTNMEDVTTLHVFMEEVLADFSCNRNKNTDVHFDCSTYPPIHEPIDHAEELFIKHNWRNASSCHRREPWNISVRQIVVAFSSCREVMPLIRHMPSLESGSGSYFICCEWLMWLPCSPLGHLPSSQSAPPCLCLQRYTDKSRAKCQYPVVEQCP